MSVIINCDMGEGLDTDERIMPFIHAANIACGFHAGSIDTMRNTIALCIKHHVVIGAHPSFNDRKNFGRVEMHLPLKKVYELVTEQLYILKNVASSFQVSIQHVKPHGALYNMSAQNPALARVIARAVKDFDPGMALIGLSGSHSVKEAEKLGLQTLNEVFADRTYRDDGTLTPRSHPQALIQNVPQVIKQVLQMVNYNTVTSITGKKIPVRADTICVHGDGEHAVEFAKAIFNALQ